MATYEELQKQKSLIERLRCFVKKQNGIIDMFAGVICIFAIFLCTPFSAMGVIIKAVMIISLLFFVVNIVLFILSRKNKRIPHIAHMPKVALLLILIALLVIAFVRQESTSVALFIIIIVLCVINYKFSLSYRKYWDVPDDLLRKLVKIEVLGVVIAVLQLIIAFPQLKLAYESATSDDIVGLKQIIDNYNKHVSSYQFVDIPDSLQNTEVRRAKTYQQQMYAFSLYIVHANWYRNLYIDEINAESDIVLDVMSSHNVARKDVAPTVKYMNSILKMQNCEKNLRDFQTQISVLQKFIELSKEIDSYYSSTSDSLLLSAQINWDRAENIKGYMNRIHDNQVEILKQVENSNKIINEAKGINLSKEAEIRYAEAENIQHSIKKLMEDDSYKNTIVGMDSLCLNFINFLNMVQLKHAYNVDY